MALKQPLFLYTKVTKRRKIEEHKITQGKTSCLFLSYKMCVFRAQKKKVTIITPDLLLTYLQWRIADH
jgi:hypothetical protein